MYTYFFLPAACMHIIFCLHMQCSSTYIYTYAYTYTKLVAIGFIQEHKQQTNFNKSKMDLKTKLLNFKGQEIVVPCSTWPCGEALFKEKVGEDWSNKHTPGIIQKVKLRASRNGFSV